MVCLSCCVKRLDGNLAPELRVPRTPHFAHTTFAERGEDLVAAELGSGFHDRTLVCSETQILPEAVEIVRLGHYHRITSSDHLTIQVKCRLREALDETI